MSVINKKNKTEFEIWRDIIGYEGLYQVSNLGRVKSLEKRRGYKNGYIVKEKILKIIDSNNTYLRVHLCKNGKSKHEMIHRLVAKAFIPNNNNYKYINHKDENKKNNNLENLEWCTCKYNINYGTAIERRKMKMSKEINQYDMDMNFIRKWNNVSEILTQFNVSKSCISACCRGEQKTSCGYKWRYVNED